MLSRVIRRLSSKHMCHGREFLVHFSGSSEVVKLSPRRENKQDHCRCWSSTPTTLKMTCNMFR
jgi:hypothetical protein